MQHPAVSLLKWLSKTRRRARKGGGAPVLITPEDTKVLLAAKKVPAAKPKLVLQHEAKSKKRGDSSQSIGYAKSQASHVVALFGGARRLSRAMKEAGHPKDPSCIYKWMYPYPKGAGGSIPDEALQAIRDAAVVAGVTLTAKDLIATPLVVVEHPSRAAKSHFSKKLKNELMTRGAWK